MKLKATVVLTGSEDTTMRPKSGGKGFFQFLCQVKAKLYDEESGVVIIEEVRGFFGKSKTTNGKERFIVQFNARTKSKDGLSEYDNLTLSEDVQNILFAEVIKAYSEKKVESTNNVTEVLKSTGCSDNEALAMMEKCMALAAAAAGESTKVVESNNAREKMAAEATKAGGKSNI